MVAWCDLPHGREALLGTCEPYNTTQPELETTSEQINRMRRAEAAVVASTSDMRVPAMIWGNRAIWCWQAYATEHVTPVV